MNVDIALSRWKSNRKKQAEDLAVRLKRAEKWQKRYDKLTNASTENLISARAAKLMELAAKHSIIIKGPDAYGTVHATYQKGEVTLDLTSSVEISYDGVVSMNFFSNKFHTYCFRIAVGKTSRIKDDILATLVGKK